jgi:hypothetical protein
MLFLQTRDGRRRAAEPACDPRQNEITSSGIATCDSSPHSQLTSPHGASHPYNLRHRFASLLFAEQTNPAEVAGQLGHSLQMLFGTYAHVIEELRGLERWTQRTKFGRLGKPHADRMLPKRCPPLLRALSRTWPRGPANGVLQGYLRWAVTGSNRRPPACKAGALPAELTARMALKIRTKGTRSARSCKSSVNRAQASCGLCVSYRGGPRRGPRQRLRRRRRG